MTEDDKKFLEEIRPRLKALGLVLIARDRVQRLDVSHMLSPDAQPGTSVINVILPRRS